jgi:hypothetical protein
MSAHIFYELEKWVNKVELDLTKITQIYNNLISLRSMYKDEETLQYFQDIFVTFSVVYTELTKNETTYIDFSHWLNNLAVAITFERQKQIIINKIKDKDRQHEVYKKSIQKSYGDTK